MRKLSLFAIVCFALLCTQQLFAQTQLKKWYLNQFAVDFSNGAPQVNAVPVAHPISIGSATSARFPANSHGFYDDAGNIIFYTAAKNNGSYLEYEVIDAQGNMIGKLANMPENSAEMSAIPFGCHAPNKYLLVYASYSSGARADCYSRLVYTVIDVDARTVSPSYEVDGLTKYCPDKAHAIGKPKSDGTRWLYVNDKESIVKCKIDFTQTYSNLISYVKEVYRAKNVIKPVEVELSPNQRLLTWTDHNNFNPGNFTVITLDASGNNDGQPARVITIPSEYDNAQATGIEFDKLGLDIYVGFHTYGQDINREGIYRFSHFGSNLSLLPNTRGLQKSHIELASNGRYYAAKADALVDIHSLASVSIPTAQYFPYTHDANFTNYSDINNGGIYRLPDQVDGEVISTNYSLPDLGHLTGAVCKSDAILQFPASITNYTISVEKAFQEPCVYQGTARTLDLTTICGIQCGDACNNSIRITITAELCNGESLSVQSDVFHILCGPAAPKVNVGNTVLCPGQTTWGSVATVYPAGTTIEWLQGGVVTHTGANATGLSGSFTVRVTDANGCSNETSVLLAITNCDLTPLEKKTTSSEDELSLYPNPAKDQVEVKLAIEDDIQTVVVKDKLGAKVKQATYSKGKNQKVDINGLREGVYVLELVTKKGKRYTKKLIVK